MCVCVRACVRACVRGRDGGRREELGREGARVGREGGRELGWLGGSEGGRDHLCIAVRRNVFLSGEGYNNYHMKLVDVMATMEWLYFVWNGCKIGNPCQAHTDSNTLKLETVQRRSARRIMQNYNRHASVTTMLQHLDLPTLQQRRRHSKIIKLYRIRHQLANIPTTTYITPATRNTQHYNLPYARTYG